VSCFSVRRSRGAAKAGRPTAVAALPPASRTRTPCSSNTGSG
jgi:hypothetical protein